MYRNAKGREIEPERLDPFALVVLASTFAWTVAKAALIAADTLDDALRAHGNWRRQRRDLSRSVNDTIDRL